MRYNSPREFFLFIGTYESYVDLTAEVRNYFVFITITKLGELTTLSSLFSIDKADFQIEIKVFVYMT